MATKKTTTKRTTASKTTKSPARKKSTTARKNTAKKAQNTANSTEVTINSSQISNVEIKNYIEELQLQKQRKALVDQKVLGENKKIEILSTNINKIDSVNRKLDKESLRVRNDANSLEKDLINLKLALEKAESQSKLSRIKEIKRDILANARILKDQEQTIDAIRNQREELARKQQEQKDMLLEKREIIERYNRQSVEDEFQNVDKELVDLMEETALNYSDKNVVMSDAIKEASNELGRIRDISEMTRSRSDERIEVLKTQMLNLNLLDNPSAAPTHELEVNKVVDEAESLAPKSSTDIEEEVKLAKKLDKLVAEGLITKDDRDKELLNFQWNNAIKRMKKHENESSQYNSGHEESGRKSRRRRKSRR